MQLTPVILSALCAVGAVGAFSYRQRFISPRSSQLRMFSSSNGGEKCPAIPTTPQTIPNGEVAVFALGWFWHPQRDYDGLDGVVRTVVGYTGGKEPLPTYRNIKDATEAILIEFDPSIISYAEVLKEWSTQHSPYYPSKTQYRSAIFYGSEEQKKLAEEMVKVLGDKDEEKNCFSSVEEMGTFYQGEEYHQKFLEKQKSARALQEW